MKLREAAKAIRRVVADRGVTRGPSVPIEASVPLDADARRTDDDWETFATHEPYHAVLTHEKYRTENLSDEAIVEFFASGEADVDALFALIDARVKPGFTPDSILDFGCGVGRNLVAFAARAETVVGIDVSQSMLDEAAINCENRSLGHVELIRGDDDLSGIDRQFSLVHTLIVLQHIPVERGERLFRRLVELVEPGGVAALHLTFEGFDGPAEAPERPPALPEGALPPMQMNRYDLDHAMAIVQDAGVADLYVRLTEHGGTRGAVLYFVKPRDRDKSGLGLHR